MLQKEAQGRFCESDFFGMRQQKSMPKRKTAAPFGAAVFRFGPRRPGTLIHRQGGIYKKVYQRAVDKKGKMHYSKDRKDMVYPWDRLIVIKSGRVQECIKTAIGGCFSSLCSRHVVSASARAKKRREEGKQMCLSGGFEITKE